MHVEDLKRYEVMMYSGKQLNVAKKRYKETERTFSAKNGTILQTLLNIGTEFG